MARLFILLLLFVSGALSAQENDFCNTATKLCGGQTYSSYNVGATSSCGGEDGTCGGPDLFCFGVNNTVWFTFTTNQNGGSASVTIDNITSINGDDTVQVAVISAGTACDPSTFTSVRCMNTVVSGTVLSLNNLSPNKQYWIIVDGKGSPPPAGETRFDVSVKGPAVANIVNVTSTPPASCAADDGSIEVTAPSGSMYSLNGSAEQSTGTFNGLGAGTYNITVTFSSGCDTSFTVNLVSPTITDAETIVSASDCDQPTGSVMVIGAIGGARPYTYTLNSISQQDSLFSNLAPGTYDIQVSDASDPSCVYNVTAVIPENKPVTQVATTNPDCSASNGKIVASSGGASSPFSYVLIPAAGSISGSTISNLPAGTYQLITTSANQCKDTLLVTLSEKSNITDLEVSTEDINCTGTGIGSAEVTAVTGGKAPYKYSVDGGAFQNSQSFPGIIAGQHTMTVQDANGCEFETVFAISTIGEITCDAGPDMIRYPGVTVTLKGEASAGNVVWSPSNGVSDTSTFQPVVTPLKDQLYTMVVTTSNGCTCTDEVFVQVPPQIVPVPNTFTPNGDGANDVWRIPNLEYYDDCIVDVYTRWGQRVFHSEGYEIGEEWDGRHLGVDLPAGNYYFVINLNIPIEEAENLLTGTVVIIK